jgi:hypothetical protein
MQASRRRPSPALILAIIALIASLAGTAWAAKGQVKKLAKNSVGTKQLKNKAVKTGKIANNAVTGAKVKPGTLTGADINLNQLGTVPEATNAQQAQNANTVNNHSAACPGGTTLIRGTCFDLALNPKVDGVKDASSACAAKGGYLPTTMELYSVRTVINLGTGIAPDYAVSDQYYANEAGGNYRTLVVDGAGDIEEVVVDQDARYICAYELVR